MKRLGFPALVLGAVLAAAVPARADEDIDRMCVDLGKGSGTDLETCREDEEYAAFEVWDWLEMYGLLNADDKMDMVKIEAAMEDDTPAGVAGYCLAEVSDWIDLADCIYILGPNEPATTP